MTIKPPEACPVCKNPKDHVVYIGCPQESEAPGARKWTTAKCICGSSFILERYPDGHCNVGSAFEKMRKERDETIEENLKMFSRGVEIDRLTKELNAALSEMDRYKYDLEIADGRYQERNATVLDLEVEVEQLTLELNTANIVKRTLQGHIDECMKELSAMKARAEKAEADAQMYRQCLGKDREALVLENQRTVRAVEYMKNARHWSADDETEIDRILKGAKSE